MSLHDCHPDCGITTSSGAGHARGCKHYVNPVCRESAPCAMEGGVHHHAPKPITVTDALKALRMLKEAGEKATFGPWRNIGYGVIRGGLLTQS